MRSIVPEKAYHVYLLIDSVDGVFYVGSGKTSRLHTTISEARRTGPNACMNKKAQKIREIWRKGREPELKIVFSSDSEDEVRRYEHFLIHRYATRLTNYQGIRTRYRTNSKYNPYNKQQIHKLSDALREDPIELDIAIRSAEDVVTFLKALREKDDPSTKLSDLMRSALCASDNAWIEENSARPYLNGLLDDMAQGFITLSSAFEGDDQFLDRILEMFHMDGFKWLCVEDVSVIIIRLTRAGYIRRKAVF